jgi:hypothetical protein
MIVKTSERITQIETYIELHPFCSLDSIFTYGRIPKSKTTRELVNQMVTQNIIQISKTSTGKNRYYVENTGFEDIIKWRNIDFELGNLKLEITKMGKKHRILEEVCEEFVLLLDSRLKILKFEVKYAQELGKSVNSDEMLKVTKKWEDFISNITEYNIKSKIKKLKKWMSFESSRDYYYLTHEAKSVSVLFEKEYSKKWLNYHPNAKPWIRKSRTFQQTKVARLMRPVFEKMVIVKDRYKYSLSTNDQRFHKSSIKSKVSGFENQYDEIFKRVYAEHHRILFQNPPNMENEIIKEVCKKRLNMIKVDHSKSRAYRKETKVLKDTIKQLDENPTLLHDWYEENNSI